MNNPANEFDLSFCIKPMQPPPLPTVSAYPSFTNKSTTKDIKDNKGSISPSRSKKMDGNVAVIVKTALNHHELVPSKLPYKVGSSASIQYPEIIPYLQSNSSQTLNQNKNATIFTRKRIPLYEKDEDELSSSKQTETWSPHPIPNQPFLQNDMIKNHPIPFSNPTIIHNRVNYHPKFTYINQFDVSPPEWIGILDGKSRKFNAPPSNTLLHHLHSGLQFIGKDDSNIKIQKQLKKDRILPFAIPPSLQSNPTVDPASSRMNTSKEPIFPSCKEYKIILKNMIEFTQQHHWIVR